MSRQIRKADQPRKTCLVCGRPFSWRKKWKTCWEEVKYCSDRCRNRRASVSSADSRGSSADRPFPAD